jgi:hypothetical protein
MWDLIPFALERRADDGMWRAATICTVQLGTRCLLSTVPSLPSRHGGRDGADVLDAGGYNCHIRAFGYSVRRFAFTADWAGDTGVRGPRFATGTHGHTTVMSTKGQTSHTSSNLP